MPKSGALRERIARLSAAVLRISASLDVGAVLRETVDSARALTGARYGVITTIDEAGEPQEFVTSGLNVDEQQQMIGWPDAMRFFEHLRDLPGPVRVPDLEAYVRSLGLSPDLVLLKTSLQATPMRHRGLHVGDFFLAEKEGGQAFTADDEDLLVLFASQAANAVANARAHRDEQRARADLEALVETSPVGVARLRRRDRPPRVVQRGGPAAGRQAEHARLFAGAAAGRAHVPVRRRARGRAGGVPDDTGDQRRRDGARRAGRALRPRRPEASRCWLTPPRSGRPMAPPWSMVVTLQDLAPLEELERLRAEFLGIGEPRAARAPHLDQGLDGHRARDCHPRAWRR